MQFNKYIIHILINTHKHTHARARMHALLQYVTPFDGGGEIVGYEWGGYKESRSWCTLFVGFPSMFVAPSGERLALPMYWRRTSLSTISHVSVRIFFSEQSVVIDVEGVAFRPRAVVVWRGVVAGCTRIAKNMFRKSNPCMGYMW